MQFLQSGCAVRARGARWQVVDVRAYESCRIVTLAGAAPPHLGSTRRLLEPFDTIERLDGAAAAIVVSAARWRARCRALVAADTPPGCLRQARSARIDLLPHQLEPALAVVRGQAARILLADEVGLGKTIQAGLILAELRARGWIDSALIVTPAGLRDQWTHELSARFGIEATGVDARTLRRRGADLPLGQNPWSTFPIAVVSTDYVKRAEVLPAAGACRWDMVVVDEAHGVAGESDRRAAVEALASRASYVLLVTATPHSGDPAAFTSLCAIGSTGEPLVAFRRRRVDVRGGSGRRVHTVRVRLSADEQRMHAALARYSDAASAAHAGAPASAWLALSVLHKRAYSGAWSLLQSVSRRLAALDAASEPVDAEQIALPLDDPTGDLTAADAPPEWPADLALADPARERRLLTTLADACRAAAAAESKVAALRRLLRRSRESAIVFTEYRDTLLHIERSLARVARTAVLHGGMTRDERADALAAFERTPGTVLLATDAAGEGLNLQRTCRLVVNIELPWNPMRLEQRIGRVDRLGQSRTVHACHLVGGATNEMRILDRLKARVARAQADVGSSNPLGREDPIEPSRMARLAVTGDWMEDCDSSDSAHESETMPNLRVTTDYAAAAALEVERLQCLRRMSMRDSGACQSPLAIDRPWIVRTRRSGLRRLVGSQALLIWRLALHDRAGAECESRLVAVTLRGLPRHRTPAAMRAAVHEIADRVAAAIDAVAREWRTTAAAANATTADARLARERRMLARIRELPAQAFQPGLFDGRAARAHARNTVLAAEWRRQIEDRIAHIERAGDLQQRPPVLLLAALP